MEFDYTTNHIELKNKDLSDLDKFVKKFESSPNLGS